MAAGPGEASADVSSATSSNPRLMSSTMQPSGSLTMATLCLTNDNVKVSTAVSQFGPASQESILVYSIDSSIWKLWRGSENL